MSRYHFHFSAQKHLSTGEHIDSRRAITGAPDTAYTAPFTPSADSSEPYAHPRRRFLAPAGNSLQADHEACALLLIANFENIISHFLRLSSKKSLRNPCVFTKRRNGGENAKRHC